MEEIWDDQSLAFLIFSNHSSAIILEEIWNGQD